MCIYNTVIGSTGEGDEQAVGLASDRDRQRERLAAQDDEDGGAVADGAQPRLPTAGANSLTSSASPTLLCCSAPHFLSSSPILYLFSEPPLLLFTAPSFALSCLRLPWLGSE